MKHGPVTLRATVVTPALYSPLKPPPLRGSGHHDLFPFGKEVHREGLAHLILGRGMQSHLLKMPHGGNLALGKVAAERLGYSLRLGWKVANLDRLVPVFLHGLLLNNSTRARLDHSDGNRPPNVVEDLGHPYLPAQKPYPYLHDECPMLQLDFNIDSRR
jgi:hypothetical protein